MFFKKWNGAWNGLMWLSIGTEGGLLQSSDEISIPQKCGKFVPWLRNI